MKPVKLKVFIKNIVNSLFGNKFFKNKLPKQDNVKRILIISLYFTGDLLFHTAAIEALKKLLPGVKIDIWAKSRSLDIIRFNPAIANILTYDNIKTASYREESSSDLSGKISFLKRLRRANYDIIFDLTGKYSTGLFTLFAKPKYSIGINYNYFGFCYDKFIPLNTASEAGHLIDKYLSVIRTGLNLDSKEWNEIKDKVSTKPYVYLSNDDTVVIDRLLNEKFGSKDVPYIVLHITSGWSAKELPPGTFAEIIKYLNSIDIRYLIVGDSNDENRINEISGIINEEALKPEKYFVKLKLTQSAELIRRSKLFIGSDSAPLHIAGSFGIPSIGLFGPTNPDFSNPVGDNHKFIYHKLHCSASDDKQYCTRNGGFTCPFYECMNTIKSFEVISLIKTLYIEPEGYLNEKD